MSQFNWHGAGAAVGAVGSIVSAFLTAGGLRAGFALVGAVLGAYFLYQVLSIYREARSAESAARAAEQAALMAELAAARSQADKWITNHLDHDREEREKHAKILESIAGHLSASAELLRSLDSSVRDGFQASAKEHAKLRLDIANNKTGRRKR